MKKNKYGETQFEKKDYKDMAGGAAIVGGAAGVKHVYDRGHLTGRETLYHNTHKDNVNSILEHGLKSEKALDPDNITNQVLKDVNKDEIANKVYFGRKKRVADAVGNAYAQREAGIFDIAGQMKARKNRETLKAKVPVWKMKEVDNPELRGAKNYAEWGDKLEDAGNLLPGQKNNPLVKQQLKQGFKDLGREGTAVIEGDVGASVFKKSKNFKRLGADELKDFIKNNKGRFAKGVGGAALGLGVAGLGAKMIYDNHKKEDKQAEFNEYELEKIASYKEDILSKAFSEE